MQKRSKHLFFGANSFCTKKIQKLVLLLLLTTEILGSYFSQWQENLFLLHNLFKYILKFAVFSAGRALNEANFIAY